MFWSLHGPEWTHTQEYISLVLCLFFCIVCVYIYVCIYLYLTCMFESFLWLCFFIAIPVENMQSIDCVCVREGGKKAGDKLKQLSYLEQQVNLQRHCHPDEPEVLVLHTHTHGFGFGKVVRRFLEGFFTGEYLYRMCHRLFEYLLRLPLLSTTPTRLAIGLSWKPSS